MSIKEAVIRLLSVMDQLNENSVKILSISLDVQNGNFERAKSELSDAFETQREIAQICHEILTDLADE